MSKVLNRRELYRRRREIMQRNRTLARHSLLAGILVGLAAGYGWAASAYSQHVPQRPTFRAEPAAVHHAPPSLPLVPANGKGTGQ